MKLRKLSFKNFKSYSNIMTEIEINENYSLNLIVGENGTGKTSIAECVTYLLYGKIENFNASDIPNRINKNFYGKLEVECDGHELIIERGLNPSLFNVQIDGNVIDTAGKNNVQTMLEETYYHIPYSVVRSVIILEVGEVKSLLSMNPADKRNIIDKICGFEIYNLYSKFVKEDIKELESERSKIQTSITTMQYNLEHCEKQLSELNNSTISQEEIDDLKNKIYEALQLKTNYENTLKKLRDAGDKLKGTNIQKIGEYQNLKEKIKEIDEKINLIDGGKCPTCGTSLETEVFQLEKEELLNKKEEYKNQMLQIVEMVNKAKDKIQLLNKKENELYKNMNSSNLTELQSDLKYKSTIKNRDSSPIESMKTKLIQDINNLQEEKNKLDEEYAIIEFLVKMFVNGDIKKFIANKYIPIINNLIKDMINFMNINYTVTFDNNFDATILQNGVKVKYSTLSKGEKRRVDFATVVAFIKFLKLQFGELNLLFLDEIFSNVDTNGVDDMINILKDLSKQMNLNIYLIHHARVENVMFDNILQTKKVDGFSQIEFLQ